MSKDIYRGWEIVKTEAGCFRIVSPSGQEYAEIYYDYNLALNTIDQLKRLGHK